MFLFHKQTRLERAASTARQITPLLQATVAAVSLITAMKGLCELCSATNQGALPQANEAVVNTTASATPTQAAPQQPQATTK